MIISLFFCTTKNTICFIQSHAVTKASLFSISDLFVILIINIFNILKSTPLYSLPTTYSALQYRCNFEPATWMLHRWNMSPRWSRNYWANCSVGLEHPGDYFYVTCIVMFVADLDLYWITRCQIITLNILKDIGFIYTTKTCNYINTLLPTNVSLQIPSI